MATLAPESRMVLASDLTGPPAPMASIRSDLHSCNVCWCRQAQAVQTAAHGMRANLDHSR